MKGAPTPPEGSRVVRFADGLLEATPLAALAVVPLFFNPLTERVFEADKLAWVLGLGLASAWALAVHASRRPLVVSRPGPLVAAVALALIVLLVGTLASTVPLVSWCGLYRRGHGMLTALAYAALFAAAAVGGRSPAVPRRWIRAASVVTAPVALYAVLQRLGIDNVTWGAGASPSARPFGPLGNPIFLGAFLIMVLPVTVAGLLVALAERKDAVPGATARAAGHALAAGLALSALGLSQSRGPVLGLLVGAAVFAVLWAVTGGRRRLAIGAVAACVALLGAILVVGRLDVAGLGRLGDLVSVGSRTAQQRVLLWGALADLASSEPARALYGHGPGTMPYDLPPLLPEALVRLAPDQVFDEAHNVVWEWWLSAGALGVAALALLYLAAFDAALAVLGLSAGASRRRLALACVGGAAVGVAAPVVAGQAALAAVGAPAGMVGGFIAHVLATGHRRPGDDVAVATPSAPGRGTGRTLTPSVAPRSARSWLAVALASALAAHLVEGALGLPTAAGELTFWLFLGFLVAMARGERDAAHGDSARSGRESPARRSGGARGRRPATEDRGAHLTDAVVDGLVLAAIAFAPWLVVGRTGTLGHPAMWLLPLAVWVVADLLAPTGVRSRAVPAVRLGMVALLLALRLALGGIVGGGVIAFALTLGAATVALAVVGSVARPGGGREEPWRVAVACALALVGAVAAWQLAVVPVVADAHVRAGLERAAGGDAANARIEFDRAIALWPQQPILASYLAAAYHDRMVDSSAGESERDSAYRAAEDALVEALRRVPDLGLRQRLANLYRDRADAQADPEARRGLLGLALDQVDLALARSPHDPGLLAERGAVRERTGDTAGARADFARAVDIGYGNVTWLVGLARTTLAAGDVVGGAGAMGRALDLVPAGTTAVGRAVDQAVRVDPPLAGATASQVVYLALVGRTDEARRLHGAMAEQLSDDPALAGLGTWLDGR